MKTQLAIWAGKTAGVLSQTLGYGGSTIPGVVARKLDGHFLRHLKRNAKIIFYITGTNGKTTTANLIAHLLESVGKSVITNREGSNLVTGISASLVRNTPFIGWMEYDVAVIEVDEASLPKAVAECPPDYLIITNFFRDQLDRYGELDILIKKMKDSLKSFNGRLILNADDPFANRFSELKTDNIYVGLNADAGRFDSFSTSESKFCPNCQKELLYSVLHFGQLGHYQCTCGFARPRTTTNVEKIYPVETGIKLKVNGQYFSTFLKGMYNAYNVLFAVQACKLVGLKTDEIRNGLETYQSTNGRMQKFVIGNENWSLNLVKNPAGANVTLSEYFKNNIKKQFLFCLNDNLADGQDISWIWDVDMELANQGNIEWFIASGKRAHDAALRMKYAGFPEEKMIILSDMKEAVLYAKRMGLPTYIMTTYTCLSPMMEILSKEEDEAKKGDKKHGTTFTLPFLSRNSKPVWGQGKYHMFKKTVRMEGNLFTNRRNHKP